MNTCILITSHLDSPSKRSLSQKLLDTLSRDNIPIILAGNYPIPESLQSLSDYSFYIRDNPIPSNREITRYWSLTQKAELGKNLNSYSKTVDYGYSHLYQTYKSSQCAKSLGFDHIIHINYDMEITYDQLQELKKKILITPNIVFPFGTAYATNIYCFNIADFIQTMEKNLDNYLENKIPQNWLAENFFQWSLEKESIQHTLETNLIIKEGIGAFEIVGEEYGTFSTYHHKEKNLLVIKFSNFTNYEKLDFIVNGSPNPAFPTPDSRYFTCPYLKGEYYVNGNCYFIIDDSHGYFNWIS